MNSCFCHTLKKTKHISTNICYLGRDKGTQNDKRIEPGSPQTKPPAFLSKPLEMNLVQLNLFKIFPVPPEGLLAPVAGPGSHTHLPAGQVRAGQTTVIKLLISTGLYPCLCLGLCIYQAMAHGLCLYQAMDAACYAIVQFAFCWTNWDNGILKNCQKCPD